MGRAYSNDAAYSLLASAHVLATSIRTVVEDGVLRKACTSRVPFSTLKLLKLIAVRETSTVHDVARFLEITDSAASKTIDKLVRQRWVRRQEGRPDRREARLSLTPHGRRLVARYEAAKTVLLREIFSHFPAHAVAGISSMLDRIAVEVVRASGRRAGACLQCGMYYRRKCLLATAIRRTCFYEDLRARGRDVHVRPRPGRTVALAA